MAFERPGSNRIAGPEETTGAERLRAALDTLVDGFGIYTAIRDELGLIVDFRIDHVNLTACQTSRLSREQQVGRQLLALFPAHRDTGLFDMYCRVMATGEPLEIDEICPDDIFEGERQRRVFTVRASKLGDGVSTTWRDITERKQAALVENEARFRKLAGSNIIGVVFGDIHGGISYANDEWLRIIGYTREEFELGHIGWATVTPPEWLEVARRTIAQARAGDGICPPYEKEYIRKDGTRIWVLMGFTLYSDDETVAFILDLSELKRSESALRESEERLSLAIEASRLGIWDRDIVTEVAHWSRHFESIFGYGLDHVSRTHHEFAERIDPEDLPVVDATYAAAMEARTDFRCTHRVIWPDGTVRWVQAHGRFYYDAEGRPIRSLGVVADITDLKKAEDALREADRRKDEFLAMLAHELRNPLSAVDSALAVLRSPGSTKDDLDWASDVALRQLKNLVRLIDDLLDVSRISRGKISLTKRLLDAKGVLERAVESVRPLITARRHELTVTVQGPDLPLAGDPTRLEQVFANLINNAAKYTAHGGRIWVTAGRADNELKVSIRDTGVGITPEMLPRVFDLFAQADTSIDRAQGGLGIGLALVRMLVEMHGGRVSAKSEGHDKGSEFVVRLPLADVQNEIAREPGNETALVAPVRAQSRRVLVVDDNADTLEGLAKLLKHAGYDVVTTRDGPSAVAAARAFQPEVVLLDIGLPGMSGYEVAEMIRRQGLIESRLIAISGYSQDKDRELSRRAGFDQHLSKPVDFDTLIAIIECADGAWGDRR